MATKVDNMGWLELVDEFKLKDNGLKVALQKYAQARTRDESDEALKALTDLAKAGNALKGSKEAKAAGPEVIKRIGKLLDGIATSQKEWQLKKAEQAKTGCHQNVQIILERWDGKNWNHHTAKVEIFPIGGDTIKKEMAVPGTVLKISDVYLRPKGALTLSVYRGGDLVCKGTADFKFTPGKDKHGLEFRFLQDSKQVKVTAKHLEEVSKKLGWKGGASLEIKVLTINGEVTKESEYKQGYEEQVEWAVEVGAEKFKEAKQVV